MPNKPITIIRTPRNNMPYFIHPRETAQDSRLSFEARGMISYLLSKPRDWEIQIEDLKREGGIGRDKVYSIIKELKENCYLKFEQFRENGQFCGSGYRLYETPYAEKPETDEPETDSPLTVLPDTANPLRHSTDSSTESTDPDLDPEQITETNTGAQAREGQAEPQIPVVVEASDEKTQEPDQPVEDQPELPKRRRARKPRPRNHLTDAVAFCAYGVPRGNSYGRSTFHSCRLIVEEIQDTLEGEITFETILNIYTHALREATKLRTPEGVRQANFKKPAMMAEAAISWDKAGRPDYDPKKQPVDEAAKYPDERVPAPPVPTPTLSNHTYIQAGMS